MWCADMMLRPEPPQFVLERERQAPHNLEVEQALLGAVLLNNSALERIDSLLPDHFFDPLHGEIYKTTQDMVASGRLASPLTLKTVFGDRPAYEGLLIWQYLANLAANATSIANVAQYAQTIRALSTRRALIILGEDMVASCFEGAVDIVPDSIVEDMESSLLKLAETGPKGSDEITFAQAIDSAIERANEAHKRGGGLTGLSTGLTDLDARLGGMAPSDLIILGGRPGAGKTALATNIAEGVALEFMQSCGKKGAVVHFFSQEMSAEQLATRVVGRHAEVPSDLIRRGMINQPQFSKMMESGNFLRNAPLIIDQTGGLSLAQLMARARRLKRRKNTGLIVIDYLQLMHGSSKENRTQDLTQITNGLKALAKELQVPILVLSQLSRQVESRDEKRPTLSDLRESGSIEQDADIVMFVFREEYYVNLRKPGDGDVQKTMEWEADLAKVKGKAEVILAKHRHGPTGTVNLAFNGELTSFSNLAREHQITERFSQ